MEGKKLLVSPNRNGMMLLGREKREGQGGVKGNLLCIVSGRNGVAQDQNLRECEKLQEAGKKGNAMKQGVEGGIQCCARV